MKPTNLENVRKKTSYEPAVANDLNDSEATDDSGPAQTVLTAPAMDKRFKPLRLQDLPSNFFIFCVAPRRNGKTEQILHMARFFHAQKRFTHYFLISQTLSGYEEYIPHNYQFVDLTHVGEIIQRVQQVAKYNQGQDEKKDMVKCSVLLILDDVVGNPADIRQQGSIMQKIAVNGRHITRDDPLDSNEFCTVLISQRITLIPPPIRNNADIILASRLASYMERKTLIENYLSLTSDRDGLREARRVFDMITLSKEYRFIAILTHVANRQAHTDYVYYQDAEVNKPSVKLFGTEEDWKVKKQDIVF